MTAYGGFYTPQLLRELQRQHEEEDKRIAMLMSYVPGSAAEKKRLEMERQEKLAQTARRGARNFGDDGNDSGSNSVNQQVHLPPFFRSSSTTRLAI